jgi:hypothetical protein
VHLRKLNSSRCGVETELIGRTRTDNSTQISKDAV